MKKTAFVSGGSRGIGRGYVRMLAQKGYDVAFTYNSKAEDAEELKREMEKQHSVRVFYYQASMQEDGAAERVMQYAIDDLGRLDVLICNAGLTVHNNLLRLTEEEIDFAYRLDFLSYLVCIQKGAEQMIRQGEGGRILMTTSSRGLRAYPEDPLYGGMKAGLHRACESLALELCEYGITVNCIAPGNTAIRGGFTEAELKKGRFQRKIPMGRAGTPDEVAALAGFLISDQAGYITGDVIRIDGGLILPVMPDDGSEEAGGGWHILPRHIR